MKKMSINNYLLIFATVLTYQNVLAQYIEQCTLTRKESTLSDQIKFRTATKSKKHLRKLLDEHLVLNPIIIHPKVIPVGVPLRFHLPKLTSLSYLEIPCDSDLFHSAKRGKKYDEKKRKNDRLIKAIQWEIGAAGIFIEIYRRRQFSAFGRAQMHLVLGKYHRFKVGLSYTGIDETSNAYTHLFDGNIYYELTLNPLFLAVGVGREYDSVYEKNYLTLGIESGINLRDVINRFWLPRVFANYTTVDSTRPRKLYVIGIEYLF